MKASWAGGGSWSAGRLLGSVASWGRGPPGAGGLLGHLTKHWVGRPRHVSNECIGCGACIESCPYDARYQHPEGYVDKCTFCQHRLKKGELPACVSVCPTKCMYFGDLDNPNSEVSRLLKNRKYKTLAPEAGTKPHVYYLI